jgi:superoxide reductase
MKQTILKCAICGAVAEVLVECQSYAGLQCCGQPMQEEIPQTADRTKEKHVPVGEVFSKWETKVTVGTTLHPMTEEHRILWIEIIDGDMRVRKYLKAGERPEAVFPISFKPGVILREYCNIHGLWEYEYKE